MTLLNFHDNFHVEFTGAAATESDLVRYYNQLLTSEDANPDLTCTVETLDPSPHTILGDPDRYYGVTDDGFVIKREYDGTAIISNDWSHIRFSDEGSKYFKSDILEYVVRKSFAKEGSAMVHASGVRTNDTTIVFPAWRHTGKTNTLLTLLRDGGSYLSDDRLWLRNDGTALGHPLPINMLSYNYNSFPGLGEEDQLRAYRRQISDFIHDRTVGKESFIYRAAYFTNKLYLEPPNTLCSVDELFTGVDYLAQSSIDAIVFLQTSGMDDIILSEMEIDNFVEAMTAINYHEWSKGLEDHIHAQRVLDDTSNEYEAMKKLWEREAEIFSEVAESVPVYQLRVPREHSWTEEGVANEIRSALSPLIDE